MSEKNSTTIPNYLTASTLDELRRLMLLNNARMSAYVHYFDIQVQTIKGKPKWIAWFYEDAANVKNLVQMNPKSNGTENLK